MGLYASQPREFELNDSSFVLPEDFSQCPSWWQRFVMEEGNPNGCAPGDDAVEQILMDNYGAIEAYTLHGRRLQDDGMLVVFPDAMQMMAFIWRWSDDI